MKRVNPGRRLFVGLGIAAGLGLFIYTGNEKNVKTRFYSNSMQVLLHSAYHLFPISKLGPGAKELHISSYLSFVLKDERIAKDEREYFLQGALWLEESAFEEYGKSFLNLSIFEKEKLFQAVCLKSWGENFIYTSLTYIFEALLSAPVYGSNTDEIGWKWLDHAPGFPQPEQSEDVSYAV